MAPLVSKHWRQATRSGDLFLIYIAPTKALVNDLEKRLHTPLSTIGLRVGIRHGDRDDLTNGPAPHVLITTPESLDVLLFRGELALRSVRAVVVDEVHLLYNGFYPMGFSGSHCPQRSAIYPMFGIFLWATAKMPIC
jgi:ATP-dependent Lhr-like helicase